MTEVVSADTVDEPSAWQTARRVRLASILASASSALASIAVSFTIPLRYPGMHSFDPGATRPAHISLGLIALGAVLLLVGAIATVRMDSSRRSEPDYSSYGAFLGVVLTLAVLGAAVVARGTFVE